MSVRVGVLAVALWLLVLPVAGCGGKDLVIGGALPPTAIVTPTTGSCVPSGGQCAVTNDCCVNLICNVFSQCQ